MAKTEDADLALLSHCCECNTSHLLLRQYLRFVAK